MNIRVAGAKVAQVSTPTVFSVPLHRFSEPILPMQDSFKNHRDYDRNG